MTPRSSIFSFETLRIKPRLSKAVLLALVLLIAAELMARAAVRSGKIELDLSAQRLLEAHSRQIAAEKPDIWLLGNSTLHYGVDETELQRQGSLKVVKLPHGSATANASAILLGYYLESAPKMPKRVVLFLSKDDLNLNGLRADVSREYGTLTQHADGPSRGKQTGRFAFLHGWRESARTFMSFPKRLTLWQAKGNITGAINDFGKRMLHKAAGKAELEHFSGKIEADDPAYLALTVNYQLDRQAIGKFAKAAHAHGITDVVVVMVPTTDEYVRYHDRLFPNETYDRIRADLAQLSAANGVAFYDDWAKPSDQYVNFRDGYHLNDTGKKMFTAELARSGRIAQ